MKRKAGKYEKKKDDDLLKKNPVRFDYDNADIMDDKDEEDEDVDDDKPPKDLGAKTVSKKRSRLQHNYYSVMTDDDLVNKEISSPKEPSGWKEIWIGMFSQNLRGRVGNWLSWNLTTLYDEVTGTKCYC
ncbi:hypothetical protein OROHE_021262 [Orobanche hederae]